MNLIELGLNGLKVTTGLGLQLLKVGTWGTMNQWTGQEYKKSANEVIGTVERQVDYGRKKLEVIRNK